MDAKGAADLVSELRLSLGSSGKVIVFWDVRRCVLIAHRRFGVIYCFYLQRRKLEDQANNISNILSLYQHLSTRNQFSYPYKTKAKLQCFLHISNFTIHVVKMLDAIESWLLTIRVNSPYINTFH
jgi:hypothetical protein